MKVYQFIYCPCIHESAWATMSIHLSKEGAENAMTCHKEEEKKKWQQMVDGYEDKGTEVGWDIICPFGEHEDWSVSEIEILP